MTSKAKNIEMAWEQALLATFRVGETETRRARWESLAMESLANSERCVQNLDAASKIGRKILIGAEINLLIT